MIDPLLLLDQAQAEAAKPDFWINTRYEPVKRTTNTGVGAIGQLFVEKLCLAYNLTIEFPIKADGKRSSQSPWDIKIQGLECELKTATLDTTGAFQFNHIRYHRNYDALLCLGITPTDAYFAIWTAADVKTGKAGNLVSMEKNANASFKLTKKPKALSPINDFIGLIKPFCIQFSQPPI